MEMMRFFLLIVNIFFLTNFKNCVCSLTINGSISIHSLIFEKVIQAFDHVLVKFDEPFPYGEKEDVFKEISQVTISISNLITATVGIADYGEKENADLGDRYKITKSDFPAYRLFNRDLDHPVAYKGEIKVDAIKSFIVEQTGAYIGLNGCLEEFDQIAKEFVNGDAEIKDKIISLMTNKVKDLKSDKIKHASAEKYLKIATKIRGNGVEFVKTERERLRKLSDGNVSDNKKLEIKMRLNILHSFQSGAANEKMEL